MDQFSRLRTFIERVPGIEKPVHADRLEDGNWWVQFTIDITHPLAWNVVQEFAFALNGISVTERLPTTFRPVSPPPYLNGGPRYYLAWVIDSTASNFTPSQCAEWLEGRLPRPVEDASKWPTDE